MFTKKLPKLIFNNFLFFPKHNIPKKFTLGNYLSILFINGILFFVGIIILSTCGVLAANLLGYFFHTDKFSDVHMYNINITGILILVPFVLILSIYELLSIIHFISSGINNFSYLISSTNSNVKNIYSKYNREITKITKLLKQKVICEALNNNIVDFEKEFTLQRMQLIERLKSEFVENELRTKVNMSNIKNISDEKFKIESDFDELFKF